MEVFSAVYRGNLARVHALAEAQIPLVLTAFALLDRAEAFAAVYCKAHGQSAYGIGKDLHKALGFTFFHSSAHTRHRHAANQRRPAQADQIRSECK